MSNNKEKYTPRLQSDRPTEKFTSAEEAWFWFISAQQAKAEGARFTSGLALIPRPCEPIDILKIVDRLYRSRRLLVDHMQVLRHYSKRMTPPDRRRPKEIRASYLWAEAMDRIERVMIEKELVNERPVRHSNWFNKMKVYEAAE